MFLFSHLVMREEKLKRIHMYFVNISEIDWLKIVKDLLADSKFVNLSKFLM